MENREDKPITLSGILRTSFIYLEGLRETTMNLSPGNQYLDQDLNSVPPVYEAGLLRLKCDFRLSGTDLSFGMADFNISCIEPSGSSNRQLKVPVKATDFFSQYFTEMEQ
jgi:hypothetical protein